MRSLVPLLLAAALADECPADESARPKLPTLKYVQFNDSDVAYAGAGRVVHVVPNLLEVQEAEVLIETIREHKAKMTHLDSIDGLPSYELYIRQSGVDVIEAAASLSALFGRLESTVHTKYDCDTCFVCHALLRRYQPTERTRVPAHFDRHAFVTAVAQLNPTDFEGGLFLQQTARPDSREFFSRGPRDVLLHQYDLSHGVDVVFGKRYSAVFWLSNDEAACKADVSPWYVDDAKRGSMFAQDALMELHALGQHGYSKDLREAVKWGTLAAEQGHAASQARLGRLYLAGEGVLRDPALGLSWVQKAAAQGYPSAEYTMGVACQYGDAKGGLEGAAAWFRSAAESGEPKAQHEYGLALVNGDGVRVDRRSGAEWLRKAAEQGHVEAKEDLAQLMSMVEANGGSWGEEDNEASTPEASARTDSSQDALS